ncbi:MAG: hypothetical protein H7A51_07750 [Akkermansiaceae bacterium]|nr:hypothetical protein [Akkermansiaceae bacterium]MCP5536118.1 hypothetical protein [Akkermansiaceae bacterium]
MKHANTILCLFGAVSLAALILWAVHDLWVVMLVLFCIAGVHALVVRKS